MWKMQGMDCSQGPKIVLIGNSNLAFGINSEEIEQEIGMPVVNMGLHASLGNAFLENMAKLNVCEGDIYVICHHTYDMDGDYVDRTLMWITIEDHFELWKMLRAEDIWPMLKTYPIYLKRA